jgi:DNA-binding transcriptional regulator of glucitol operon
VIVSPVRDHREQYRIAPAEEHYVTYVYGENDSQEEMLMPQGRMVNSSMKQMREVNREVTHQMRPARMSYSEAKEHFANQKISSTRVLSKVQDGPN